MQVLYHFQNYIIWCNSISMHVSLSLFKLLVYHLIMLNEKVSAIQLKLLDLVE